MNNREVRDRSKPLRVYVSDSERQKIKELASLTQLQPTSYLREVGLAYQPKSRFDKDAIRELMKLRADQGRLGGLLKLWLSEKRGEGVPAHKVRDLLQQIESLQQQLAHLVMKEATRL